MSSIATQKTVPIYFKCLLTYEGPFLSFLHICFLIFSSRFTQFQFSYYSLNSVKMKGLETSMQAYILNAGVDTLKVNVKLRDQSQALL